MASFPDINGKKVWAFAERDGFRKLRFYKPEIYSKMDGAVFCPFIKTYVSLRDHRSPSFFMQPCYSGNNWIFMSKVAIMLDENVIFERNFSNDKVERNVDSPHVEEFYNLIATESEINSLRKITQNQRY